MAGGRGPSLGGEESWSPAIGLPGLPETGSERRLEIAVVFTSAASTVRALRAAATLARGLNAHVSLIVPQVVPYPLPLEKPPVPLDFTVRRLLEIAGATSTQTTIRLYLCRQRAETVIAALKPRSIVFIGARKRLWRTKEQTLAHRLRRTGHTVVLAE